MLAAEVTPYRGHREVLRLPLSECKLIFLHDGEEIQPGEGKKICINDFTVAHQSVDPLRIYAADLCLGMYEAFEACLQVELYSPEELAPYKPPVITHIEV